jgi:hypothetical protein
MENSQSTNPGALAALQQVVEQGKVLAVIGTVKSTQVLYSDQSRWDPYVHRRD